MRNIQNANDTHNPSIAQIVEFTGQKPNNVWTQSGTDCSTAVTLDEAIERAGLGYKVDVVPSYQKVNTPDGDEYYRKVEGTNYTIRADTQAYLGTVGDRYHPIQGPDVVRVLEPLLDNGIATLARAGTMYGGRDIFMQVDFKPGDSEVDEFQKRLNVGSTGLLTNNHGGQRKLMLQTTTLRFFCWNQLRMAHHHKRGAQDTIFIRHGRDGTINAVQAAKELWGQIAVNQRTAMKDFELLERTMLTDADFDRLVLDVALPLATPDETDSKRAATLREKQVARREQVRDRWFTGKSHDGSPTAYYALNGLVECLDHEPTVFKVRGDENRFAALTVGKFNELKATVATNLVKFALASK